MEKSDKVYLTTGEVFDFFMVEYKGLDFEKIKKMTNSQINLFFEKINDRYNPNERGLTKEAKEILRKAKKYDKIKAMGIPIKK